MYVVIRNNNCLSSFVYLLFHVHTSQYYQLFVAGCVVVPWILSFIHSVDIIIIADGMVLGFLNLIFFVPCLSVEQYWLLLLRWENMNDTKSGSLTLKLLCKDKMRMWRLSLWKFRLLRFKSFRCIPVYVHPHGNSFPLLCHWNYVISSVILYGIKLFWNYNFKYLHTIRIHHGTYLRVPKRFFSKWHVHDRGICSIGSLQSVQVSQCSLLIRARYLYVVGHR